jgi:hypothetical protein
MTEEDEDEGESSTRLVFPAETMAAWCKEAAASAFLRFLGSTVSRSAGNAALTFFAKEAGGLVAAASTQAGPLPANVLEDWLRQHPAECSMLNSGECVKITAANLPAGLLAPVMDRTSLEGAFYLETIPPEEVIQQLCWLLGQAGSVLSALRLESERCEAYADAFHAVRTPLMSVRGYTKMLLEGQAGALNAQQKEYLMVVLDNAERMVRVVRNTREPEAAQ